MALEQENLHVVVHYVAAEKPFVEDAPRSETVGELKAQSIRAFGLSEGNNVSYTLYDGKSPLENSNQTLGSVAGQKHELNLNLVQQITQG